MILADYPTLLTVPRGTPSGGRRRATATQRGEVDVHISAHCHRRVGRGVEALTTLAQRLPEDLPAAVLVVVHVAPTSPGFLAGILARAAKLPAGLATEGAPIRPGRIYVAPPGRHMIVHDGFVGLRVGPRVNHNRPAVDPLFRSAARWYGRRVIGVVLTGILDDGTAGLLAIKQRGGVTVAQDPADALYPGMPHSAVIHVDVDYVVPLSDMAPLLERLAWKSGERLEEGDEPVPEEMDENSTGAQRVAQDMAVYESG